MPNLTIMNTQIPRIHTLWVLAICVALFSCTPRNPKVSQYDEPTLNPGDSSSLVIIWASSDKDVAKSVVLNFVLNARLNGWLDNITLMVWGPSVKLLASDKELQDVFKSLKHTGINLYIDKGSAEDFGVGKAVEDMGAEVAYLGKTLSVCIKQNRKIITF